MRILALTHVFPRADDDPAAPFLLTWARALRTAGADVGVIAPHDAGLPNRDVVAGVPVRRVRYAPERHERIAYQGQMHHLMREASGPLLAGALVSALAWSLRIQASQARPDVVHVHWWVPGMLAARLARVPVPVVCTVHGTDVALIEARPALAPVARWALHAADRVEAVSSDLADRLLQATGRRADGVNPMPLPEHWSAPPEPHAPPRASTLHVLAVGRLVPEKGFADLVAALARVDLATELTLVGEGPQGDALRAQAGALGVPLHMPGRLDAAALARAYRCADVVVQPSHREGLGLVAVEALLSGVPVVATDSGGVRDVLPADALVPIGDPVALAHALQTVAHDLDAARAAAARLGNALRARFSPDAAARRTFDGYAQVAPRRNARAVG